MKKDFAALMVVISLFVVVLTGVAMSAAASGVFFNRAGVGIPVDFQSPFVQEDTFACGDNPFTSPQGLPTEDEIASCENPDELIDRLEQAANDCADQASEITSALNSRQDLWDSVIDDFSPKPVLFSCPAQPFDPSPPSSSIEDESLLQSCWQLINSDTGLCGYLSSIWQDYAVKRCDRLNHLAECRESQAVLRANNREFDTERILNNVNIRLFAINNCLGFARNAPDSCAVREMLGSAVPVSTPTGGGIIVPGIIRPKLIPLPPGETGWKEPN